MVLNQGTSRAPARAELPQKPDVRLCSRAVASGTRSARCASALLFVLLVASSAHADPIPSTPPDGVAVEIVSPGVSVELDVIVLDESMDVDRFVSRCSTPCRLTLPMGRYRLFVHRTSNTLAGRRKLDIGGPTTVVLEPKGPSQRNIGLTLGIVGSVALIFGVGMALGGANFQEDPERATIAASLLVGGLIATPVGWVMFGVGRRPGMTVEPRGRPSAASESRAEVGGSAWIALRTAF